MELRRSRGMFVDFYDLPPELQKRPYSGCQFDTICVFKGPTTPYKCVNDLPGLTTVDGIAEIAGNYSSKGTGERAAWFRDSEGNLLGIGQPVRS